MSIWVIILTYEGIPVFSTPSRVSLVNALIRPLLTVCDFKLSLFGYLLIKKVINYPKKFIPVFVASVYFFHHYLLHQLTNVIGICRLVDLIHGSFTDANELKGLKVVPDSSGILLVRWFPDTKTGDTTYKVTWERESSINSQKFMHVGTVNITGMYYCCSQYACLKP